LPGGVRNKWVSYPLPEIVSGYNVVRKLGDGARAQVFQVVKVATGQIFSLKRVVREEHEDDRFLQQAISEFEHSSRFDHPYLRKAYELHRIRSFFKLNEVQVILEYVEGLGLDQNRPTRVDKAVEVSIKLAQALQAMHDAGYLHADIKPNNILLTPDGGVKIIDFGQSCPVGFRKPRIQGTPDYIAPEQVERKHLTCQTDVFNLGATLYWALTGQTYPTLITKKNRDRGPEHGRKSVIPTPQQLNPEVPSLLSRLVMESCAFDRSLRPKDMKEVIARLEAVQALLARREAQPGLVEAGEVPDEEHPEPAHLDDSGELRYDFSALHEAIEEHRDEKKPKSE
jgi:serine/threonine-protein kinase